MPWTIVSDQRCIGGIGITKIDLYLGHDHGELSRTIGLIRSQSITDAVGNQSVIELNRINTSGLPKCGQRRQQQDTRQLVVTDVVINAFLKELTIPRNGNRSCRDIRIIWIVYRLVIDACPLERRIWARPITKQDGEVFQKRIRHPHNGGCRISVFPKSIVINRIQQNRVRRVGIGSIGCTSILEDCGATTA